MVAAGNEVDKLVTVDPVSRRRPDFEKVAEHSGVWHNYVSTSREWEKSNIIGRIGRPWGDAPDGIADSHNRVDMTHADICVEFLQTMGTSTHTRRLTWRSAGS